MTLILRNKNIKDELIMRGLENVKKFSWEECADNYIKFLQNKR
jgi:glycosyltransferase involved in cell wall biosynthesis